MGTISVKNLTGNDVTIEALTFDKSTVVATWRLGPHEQGGERQFPNNQDFVFVIKDSQLGLTQVKVPSPGVSKDKYGWNGSRLYQI
mmetsp:Transcript_4962/g.5381  ORF Transcript_4962/g.5381 Transcript_4962/m.5381 type:complete len:86 (+) Transcript_4962:30-287(+)